MPEVNAYASPKENSAYRQAPVSGKPLAFENSYLIDSVPLSGRHYLQDHRVAGNIIYPAAGFCMAGVAVHRSLRDSNDQSKPMLLENLKFRKTLTLSDDKSAILRVRYRPQRSEFTVHSDQDDDQGTQTPHAVGSLGGTHPEMPARDRNFDRLLMRCSQTIDVNDFYRRLSRSGLDYGPFFKRIVQARVSRRHGEAVTCISTHPELTGIGDLQARHITLLDCAFQSLAAALDPDQFNLFVPSRIRALRVFDEFEPNVWCHARLTNSTKRAVVGDITILNADKRPLIDITGVSCLKVPHSQIAGRDPGSDRQDSATIKNNHNHPAVSSAGFRN